MSFEAMKEKMRAKLTGVIPDFEIDIKAPIAWEIEKLKSEKNAVILGHNYMEAALFSSVPDFTGDSLDLSRKAAATNKDIILFCGVRFMAETAKILNPSKMVLLPSLRAGCSLAASITGDDVRSLKKKFPGVPVVTYVNTYADVKAETDVCCTSSNAKAVVESLNSEKVLFLPDEYLATNTAKDLGWKHAILSPDTIDAPIDSDVRMIGWHGKCEVHEQFTLDDIKNARKQFPGVRVLSHVECKPEVVSASDKSGSTNAMIKDVAEHPNSPILLLTECSMGDNIIAANPEANILRLCSVRCPHMAEITLEDTLKSLQTERYQIRIAEEIRAKAQRALRRMIEIG